MTFRPRPGDVALATALALLALATANELESFADAHARDKVDRTVFAHYVRHWPGRFGTVSASTNGRYDAACALHRQARGQRRPLLICVEVRRTPALGYAVGAYAALPGSKRHVHFTCTARDRCPPYLTGSQRRSG